MKLGKTFYCRLHEGWQSYGDRQIRGPGGGLENHGREVGVFGIGSVEFDGEFSGAFEVGEHLEALFEIGVKVCVWGTQFRL